MKQLIKRILKEEFDPAKEKMEKLLSKAGLPMLLNSIGVDKISEILGISKEDVFKKYNPFKNFISYEQFYIALDKQLSHILTSLYWLKDFKENNASNEDIINIIIDMVISYLHSDLINFDTETWKIPNTPELMQMIYGDEVKKHPKFKKILSLINKDEDEFDNFLNDSIQSSINESNDNLFKEKIIKSFTKNGPFKTIKHIGIDKISEELGLTPYEIINEYLVGEELSIRDIQGDLDYEHTYNFKFKIDKVYKYRNVDDYVFYIDILEGSVELPDGDIYDLMGKDIEEINDEYDGEIRIEIMNLLSDFIKVINSSFRNYSIYLNILQPFDFN